MPELHQYYAKMLEALHCHDSKLKNIFPGSMFATTMYNLGQWTICFEHKDFGNLAFGMCSIMALGDFDPRKGGHLILWGCELVIEFSPGATILIPSATMSHSNATMSEGEKWYSFTQYMARGTFCWVENGFQTSDRFQGSLTKVQLAEVEAENAGWWE